MNSTTSIFYRGMFISFLGSLPPGVMNIVAIDIAGKQGNKAAFLYAAGSMLAEVLVVAIALTIMNWLLKRKRFFEVLEWITVILLGLFATGCFLAAGTMQEITSFIPVISLPAFLAGVVISLFNPMHIPFWLGWSSYLVSKGIPVNERRSYLLYIAGIATGTMGGFTVFIYGGYAVIEIVNSNSAVFNYILGVFLLLLSVLQAGKLVLVPAAIRHRRLLKQS